MTHNTGKPTQLADRLRDYEWLGASPFILCHVAVLGAFWSGVTWQAVICAVVLYVTRMVAVTGGYHRYFSHKTFSTSRLAQFLLAFWAQSSGQKGVLWWAAHHRAHHLYADTERDPHPLRLRGFWYSHIGWIFDHTGDTDLGMVRDFQKYPELRFLNRFYLLPPILLGAAVFGLFGWPGLFVGFFASTVALWHGTFLVNSLTHRYGSRRYPTDDDSRNNLWITLVTMGEGWHNNHHFYCGSARQGWFKGEIDPTYRVLQVCEKLGLVWNLRPVPDKVYSSQAADIKHAA